MTFKSLLCVFVLLAAPAVVSAQAPLVPGSQIAFEIPNPGQMRSGASTVLRPEANIAFEYRIDGAATPVAAVKVSACTPVTPAPALTCRLVPPTLPQGEHTIEVRALVSPAEAGVNPSAYSAPLAVAVILVTGPSVPSNTRLITP